MAKLNIEARGGRGGATGGGPERLALVVSVTDEGGKPVTDLAAEHFFVRAFAPGAPEAAEAALGVDAASARGEGVYLLDLAAPAPGSPPALVLWVAVRRVFERGQCLAALASG